MLPSREEYLRRWAALHGDYEVGRRTLGPVLVGAWLRAVYACARPLAARGVPPDLLTWLGLGMAGCAVWAAAVGGSWWWAVAAVLVGLTGLFDGLDGAVAVLTDRVTPWGQVLDSTVDRGGDVLFLLALWLAGARPQVCVVAGVLVGLPEYVRARAAAAGVREVAVVTVAERPTRVIVTAAALLAAAGSASSPVTGIAWVSVGAWALVALSALALGQLTVVVHHRLTTAPPA